MNLKDKILYGQELSSTTNNGAHWDANALLCIISPCSWRVCGLFLHLAIPSAKHPSIPSPVDMLHVVCFYLPIWIVS
eukprot:5859787-Amphidinium_carterae.1